MQTKKIEEIEKSIFMIRGRRVILDRDLASLYGVPTYRFNEAIKRNRRRFPDDFAFQLTREEFSILISQFAISSSSHGGVRKLPWVFTEHGVVMAANVLRSERAIRVSVQVVRAFIRLRNILSSHRHLARKLDELENKYDRQFAVVFEAIRQLMTPTPEPPEPEPPPRKRIGFLAGESRQTYRFPRR